MRCSLSVGKEGSVSASHLALPFLTLNHLSVSQRMFGMSEKSIGISGSSKRTILQIDRISLSAWPL